MEVLELEPLKEKKLKLFLVEYEYPINFYMDQKKYNEREFLNLKFISRNYVDFIESLIKENHPAFIVEEGGMRTKDEFLYDNHLIELYKKYELPFDMVDISQNALDYINDTMQDKKNLLDAIESELAKLVINKDLSKSNELYIQKLMMWRDYLKRSYDEEEQDIRLRVREAWMFMKILKMAEKFEAKKINAMFLCDKRHFNGLSNLADELGVNIVKIEINKIVKNVNPSGENLEIIDLINKADLDIVPIKVKAVDKSEKILYFFDTDEYASPFDINMAYDAGFDVVVPFNNMTADKVQKLVQDAIFSRKPKSPTAFFIGGSNVKEGEKIAKKVLKSFVPGFETPVIIDPRGSHTTASALVAKTEQLAAELGINSLEGKKVVVLGTGPVGQLTSILAAKLRAKVYLVETWDGATEEYVKNLADELTDKAGENATKITGVYATNDESKFEILKDANIVWSVAAAGIQIVSKELAEKLSPNTIVADINAVPPMGIEGMKPNTDKKEIYPGVFGIGPLSIGRIKYTTENKILAKAAKSKGKKIFDYNKAFEIARSLLGLEYKKIMVEIK
ncbi:MAG: NAD(P)-dependent methylenetetrahydromethanopterin dehydrogenase [Candidatus Helarchaeota archaeon]